MINFNKMFDNVGGKLKKIAVVMTALGVVLGVVIIFIALIGSLNSYSGGFGIFLSGLLSGIAVPFFVWLSSLSLYAFGELVEKTVQIESNTRPKEENAFTSDVNE